MTVKLYDYQQKAVDDLSNGKILLGGTGAGKTMTSLAYYVKNENKRDIYVITTAKKRDDLEWEKDASNFGITNTGAGHNVGQLTVDSWNNIKKYQDVSGAFFIFDEQRLVGSGSWSKAFLKIARHNRWVMLTATPGDKWEDYTSIFVANGFYKNKTEYMDSHMIYTYYGGYPKLKRYINEQKLERLRRHVLVEMDYVPHTRRHINKVYSDYDKELVVETMKTLKDPETGEPFQGASGLMYAVRKIVNSDPSRVEAVKKLAKDIDKLIIFYNYDYELELLREAFPNAKERNGHNHDPLPTTKTWTYLVQYTAGAEAWNCTTTSAMVFYSMTYSYKTFMQAQGRIDRVNTPFTDLSYFVMTSDSAVDRGIERALENKKDFNERAFVEKGKLV